MSNKSTERTTKLLKDVHGIIVQHANFNFTAPQAYVFAQVLQALEGTIDEFERGFAEVIYPGAIREGAEGAESNETTDPF